MKVSNEKVKINQKVIKKLNDAADQAMDLTAQAIITDINTRGAVPKDIGTLERGSDEWKSGYVEKVNYMVYKIMYNTPYARRWYFNLDGAKFKRDTAIDHWMDYYLDGEGKDWVVETFVKFWKEQSGGLIK